MPIRTIPIDPEAPVLAPQTDSRGRPRWSMPMERTVIWIICALEIGSLLTVVAIFIHTKQPAWLYAVVIGSILFAPLLLLTSRLTITLHDDHLRWVFFPFWKGSVPYSAIENAEICSFNAMGDFGGWGPKVAKGHYGAIAASGKGVLITRSDKKRKLVLSCKESESLTLELLRRIVPVEETAAADN